MVTEPYKDASTGLWMVTVARAVYASPGYTAGGSLIGVVGADIFLTAIQNDILKVQVLESGDAALMMRNGVVVADKEWLASGSANSVVKIYNVQGGLYYNDQASFVKLVWVFGVVESNFPVSFAYSLLLIAHT